MKKLALLLFGILYGVQVMSNTYYLANNGDNNALGTSSVLPWQTIDKLNSVLLQAGDSVLFRCGDIFRGQIMVNQGGNQFDKIVFSSYGTGAKPIISGAVLNSTWVANGSVYSTSISDSVADFFVSGHVATLARYPNENQYLRLDSAQTSYLKDQSITSLATNLLQGNICIHTTQWCWEKSEINGVIGDKITYSTPTLQTAINEYGYFLYNDFDHLDTIDEWFYDKNTSTLYYQPEDGVDPNSLLTESSVYANGIYLETNVSNILISNLAFEKQSNAGISMFGSGNNYIVVDNCDFSGQYNHGVNDKGRYNEIANSTFREIGGIAVFVSTGGFKSTIHHNTFRSIGLVRNSGIGTEINSSAIKAAFIDSCYIHHNDIDTVGYCGISADGAYNLVERNVIKHAMRLNNDGAALKSYGGQSHHNTFRNNFVSQSEGNREGTNNANFVTPGIYFDFSVNNCLIENNTVFDHTEKGIFQNSGNNNNTIRENIIYQTDYALDLNGNPLIATPISGMHVAKNVFFARNDQSYVLRQVDYTENFTAGLIDSNYYFQPYNAEHYVLRIETGSPVEYSFTEWQLTGFDEHSVPSSVSWANGTNDSELFMNPSDDLLVVDLNGLLYFDLDGNDVCGNFTLEPYTSRVLLTSGLPCESSVSENESNDYFLIFPNPSSDYFYFKTSLTAFEIQVVDLSGRVILEQKMKADNAIDLQTFSPGIYHLRVQEGKKSFNYKISKL